MDFYSDSGKKMAAPLLNRSSTDLISCADEIFEERVNLLDMRGLLDLVSRLQSEMAEEQAHFDKLTAQLQKCANNVQHRKVTAALCTCQTRLAILCNRNMRCFTQQAVCTKKERWETTKLSQNMTSNDPETLMIDRLGLQKVFPKQGLGNNVFRESLKFFQSQEAKDQIIRPHHSAPEKIQRIPTVRTIESAPSVDNILSNVRTIRANQNMKYSNHSIDKYVTNSNNYNVSKDRISSMHSHKSTVASQPRNNNSNNLYNRFNPEFNAVKTENKNGFSNQELKDNNLNAVNNSSCNSYEYENNNQCLSPKANKNGLLNGKYSSSDSRMTTINRTHEILNNSETDSPPNWKEGNIPAGQKEFLDVIKKISSKRQRNVDGRFSSDRQYYDCGDNVIFNSQNVYTSNDGQLKEEELTKDNSFPGYCRPNRSFARRIPETRHFSSVTASYLRRMAKILADKHKEGEYNSRPTGDDDENLNESPECSSHSSLESTESHTSSCDIPRTCTLPAYSESASQKKLSSTHSNSYSEHPCALEKDRNSSPSFLENVILCNGNNERLKRNSDVKLDKNTEFISDKAENLNSLDSDYQPQDFVVHKTSFSEDYMDMTSEDAYSSINEEYEVEQPDDSEMTGRDISSPDFVSDEEEEFLVHQSSSEYDNEENEEYVVDNGKNYVESRRYLYYPDDKELEVIPEEDEDDLAEEDDYCFSQEHCDQGFPDYNDYNTFPRIRVQNKDIFVTECDSGVAEDQSSSEDCYLEEEVPFRSLNTNYCEERIVIEDCQYKDFHKGQITKYWNPTTKLMPKLYRMPFKTDDIMKNTINLEGSAMISIQDRKELKRLEKFIDFAEEPKHIFLKTNRGKLGFYRRPDEMPIIEIYLISGCVYDLNKCDIHVDDHRGNQFILHFKDIYTAEQWKVSLESHTSLCFSDIYCHPNFRPITSFHRVLILDIGGTSIRAGLAMSDATLPTLYFPSVGVLDPNTGKRLIGFEALHPDSQREGKINHLFCHAKKTEPHWSLSVLSDVLRYVSTELRVEPHRYKLLLVTSLRMTTKVKREIADLVLRVFNFEGVHVSLQSASSMAAYNAKTGILIEMGHKVTLTAFCEGQLLPRTECTNYVGGPELLKTFTKLLCDSGYDCFPTEISSFMARYIMENESTVAVDYDWAMQQCLLKNDDFSCETDLTEFIQHVTPENSRLKFYFPKYHAVEGLFEPDVWMLDEDIPNLRAQVGKCLDNIEDDIRIEVARNVFLAGGLINISGVPNRVESNMQQVLQPLKLKPIIHISEYSHHVSFLGAHTVATSNNFSNYCVNKDNLSQLGDQVFDKWTISANY